jgi:uncharacterized RDD family membrane protein YckC
MSYPQYPQQDPYQVPQNQYPQTAPGGELASWIQRVGAYVIDILVTAPFSVIAYIVGASTDPVTHLPSYNAFYWIFSLLGIVVSGYNRWYLQGKTGQSWGKKALGLRLVSEQTGQPVGPLMAFVRDLAHIIDGIICYIGFLFPLWDAKKQTIADKLVKTLVVK